MGFWKFAVGMLFVVYGMSASAMEGTCQCCVSVIAGSPGLNLVAGTVRGPCGRPMSMSKMVATGLPVSQSGSLAAASPAPAPVPALATASVQDNFFNPDPVTINVGDTIQWNWAVGSNFHSVTSVAGSLEDFDSGDQSVGSFSHTFTHAGTYVYYCDVHGFDFGNGTAGGMFATIKVNAVPEPVAGMLSLPFLLSLARRGRRV